ILRALGEHQTKGGIVFGPKTTRTSTLDGPRFDVAADIHPQKSLRRRTEHFHTGKSQVRGKRGRVLRPQTPVDRPARFGERYFETLRQVRLKDISRKNVLAHASDGVEIAAVRERRAQVELRIPPAAFQRIRRSHALSLPKAVRGHKGPRHIRCARSQSSADERRPLLRSIRTGGF